jgi:peptidoglycan/LPS O-acetylase OafA/YrhL
MFAFFAIITVIGLIGLIISLVCLISEQDPFALWATLLVICVLMFVIGGGCGLSCLDSETTEEHIVQEEHAEVINQYRYCPYCGKEIK